MEVRSRLFVRDPLTAQIHHSFCLVLLGLHAQRALTHLFPVRMTLLLNLGNSARKEKVRQWTARGAHTVPNHFQMLYNVLVEVIVRQIRLLREIAQQVTFVKMPQKLFYAAMVSSAPSVRFMRAEIVTRAFFARSQM